MGFGWKDGLAIANPVGWIPSLLGHATEGNGYSPSAGAGTLPLTAGGVKLADPLKKPLGAIAGKGQSSLADALGRVSGNAATSSRASGRAVGDYQGQALGRANSLASQGINNSVAGVLGSGSLKDAQNEKEFQANMALANEIGKMNSPTTLQEILGGIGGGANTALQFKGLYDSLGKNGGGSGGGTTYGLSPNSYGLPPSPSWNYDMSKLPGYSPYDYNKNWGG